MSRSTLSDIKTVLEEYIGQKIHLKANSGRRKIIERIGVLEETYPSVFVVKLDEEKNAFDRVSYSYADILTESVELTVYNQDDERIPVKYIKTAQ